MLLKGMRRRYTPLVAFACFSLVAVMTLGAHAEDGKIAVGSVAPDFSLVGSDGETYTMSQFKGKKPVVLAFFPKAFTPG